MKKMLILLIFTILSVFTLSMSASAASGTWERYSGETEVGKASFVTDESQLGPGEFMSPTMVLLIPGDVYEGVPYEGTLRIFVTNRLNRPIKGTLTVETEVVPGGKAVLDFDLEDRTHNFESCTSMDFPLLADLHHDGDYFPNLTMTIDDEPQYVYRDTDRLTIHTPHEDSIAVGESTYLEQYLNGYEFVYSSMDEKIATVSGTKVTGVADGDVYIKGHFESDNKDAVWIYEDTWYLIHVGKSAVSSDSDTESSESESHVVPGNNWTVVGNYENPVAMSPIGVTYIGANIGPYYRFSVENTADHDVTAKITGEGETVRDGKYEEEITLKKSGASGASAEVNVPLRVDFMEKCSGDDYYYTEFTAEAEDKESTISVEFNVAEQLTIECVQGSQRSMHSEFTWLSSDESVISFDGNRMTAVGEGYAQAVGTSGGTVETYNVRVLNEPRSAAERKPKAEKHWERELTKGESAAVTVLTVIVCLVIFTAIKKLVDRKRDNF